MKCPHCEHQDKWDAPGKSGAFYRLPIKMERDVMWESPEITSLYACPNCGKTFIEV